MSDISGTVRQISVGALQLRAAADINITEIITQYENSMLATSGTAMRKMTKRITSKEGLVAHTNAVERLALVEIADSRTLSKCLLINAAGDQAFCEGTIEVENNETEENRTTFKIFPSDGWTEVPL